MIGIRIIHYCYSSAPTRITSIEGPADSSLGLPDAKASNPFLPPIKILWSPRWLLFFAQHSAPRLLAFNTRRPITSSYVENNNNAFHLLGQIFYYVFIEARLHHRRDTMIATAITYAVLAFSGLIGSAIAWEDLRKATRKPAAKQS